MDYLNRFQTNGWPVVIGEFGWKFNSSEVDHDTLLAEAVSRGLGYLGWSWSGNTDPILDMATSFDPSQLTTWGQRIFNGANGIKATAKEATIYSCPTCTPSPSPSPSASASPSPSPSPTPSPTGGTRTCTASYTRTGQWPGGFQGEVRVAAGTQPITSWRVTWTWANGQSITQAWVANVTQTGTNVTATNMSYNGSLGAGQNTTFGFLATWNNSTNTSPTPACTAS